MPDEIAIEPKVLTTTERKTARTAGKARLVTLRSRLTALNTELDQVRDEIWAIERANAEHAAAIADADEA